MFVVLLEHVSHFSLYKLWKALFHVAGNLSSILTMAVSHSEKVTVFQTTEMGHCDPGVLILLVRIGWRLACFRGKGKLGDAVSVHLSWVGGVERVLLLLRLRSGLARSILGSLLRSGLRHGLRLRLAVDLVVVSLVRWLHHLLGVLRLGVGLHVVSTRQRHLL